MASCNIADWANQRVRQVTSALPGFSVSDLLVPSEDGLELYVFNGGGQHLRTLHALTGAVLHEFAYDTGFRLATVTDGSGNATTVQRTAGGAPTALVGPDGQRSALTLNSSGFLTRITNPAGEAYQFATTADGLLTALTNPRGFVTSFTYDSLGRLTRDHDPAGGVQNLTRRESDDGYHVTRSTALNAVTETYAYNGFAEPVQYRSAQSGADLYAVDYARDRLGRITAITETIGGLTDVDAYAYDVVGRLATVTKNGVPLAAYTYDGNSNRLTFIGTGGPLSGTYDSQDRLTQYGSTTYTYNAAGERQTRTASGQVTTYTYDALGNLMGLGLPGGTQLTYLVDGQNRRIAKLVNGAQVQGLLYEDDLRIAAELDAANNIVSRFVYATWDNVPDYMVKGGVTYRLIVDHVGSPRLVVNAATGAIAQRLDYDTFGNVLADTSPGFQPFGFAGGLYDPATGLVRFGARDYDAKTGTWLARDPLLFETGQTNLYSYGNNDPVNGRDPEGKQWEGELAKLKKPTPKQPGEYGKPKPQPLKQPKSCPPPKDPPKDKGLGDKIADEVSGWFK